jgi:glyoxylate reductase
MNIYLSHIFPGDPAAVFPPDWQIRTNPYGRAPTPDEARALLADIDGAVCASHRMDAAIIDAAPRLKVICCYGAGSDHIDIAHATRRGIVVANLPDEVTASTAELTWSLILSAARRIAEADRLVRRQARFTPSVTLMLGTHLAGKCLGVIGLGRIGAAVARKAAAFDMSVIYHDSRRNLAAETASGAVFAPFDAVLANADVLTIHVPLLPETRHLIDEAALDRMKPGAILINASRGPVVDEPALIRALSQGKIRAAGLDVYENEPEVPAALREMDQVVLTPHIGTSTLESRCSMTAAACRSILAVLSGQRPGHIVNPQVYAQAGPD